MTVLALTGLSIVLAGILLLPAEPARGRFFVALILPAGFALLAILEIDRREKQTRDDPLRELISATEQFEKIPINPHAIPPIGWPTDELARQMIALQGRLSDRIDNLEEDREQLRAILSGMVEGVVALDAEQRVLFANERAASLLNVELNRFVGRRLWEVIRQRPLLDLVLKALREPGPQQAEVTWNGDVERYLKVHAASLRGNPPQGAVVVLHDTSALRRLERLRQEFVANVSHELKTPLAVIKVCIETLLDCGGIDDLVNRGHFLEQIAHQSERLHALILDLLSLARIESGEENFEFTTVDLRAMVEFSLSGHLMRAQARNQKLAMVTAPDMLALEVWADEEALRQIVNNLLDNALKYTPDGGTIEVSWLVVEGIVELSVRDTGIGIPAADLPRIFERFYRVDKARSRELGGTGLGLSIVKHLAQSMGGGIRATSVIGVGSCFVVSLRLPAM